MSREPEPPMSPSEVRKVSSILVVVSFPAAVFALAAACGAGWAAWVGFAWAAAWMGIGVLAHRPRPKG